MRSPEELTPVQQAAITRLVETDQTILVAVMGAGKTIMGLTAMAELRTLPDAPRRFIIGCPAKLVQQWPKEAKRWSHTADLNVVPITGTEPQRLKLLQQSQDADVLVVSLGCLNWLLRQKHDADGIIIDELTKACGKQSSGLKLKQNKRLTWRVGMTGTPVAQSLEKLYSMARIIDGGRTFGTRREAWESRYFTKDDYTMQLEPREGAAVEILTKIRPLVHYVEGSQADSLPPLQEKRVYFHIPEGTRTAYNQMRFELYAAGVEAANAAVRSGKLRQLASGFLYDENSEVLLYDTARMDAVEAILEGLDRAVVFYELDEQGAELLYRLGDKASTNWEEFPQYLIAQFRSMSHGVDGLQHHYNNVVFVQPLWSNDAKLQAIARVWRTGQKQPVTVTTVMAEDSLDDIVVERQEGNAAWMDLFIQHMRRED